MNKLLENLNFRVYTQGIIKAHNDGKRRLIQGYASVGDVLDRQNEVITLGALVRAKEDLLANSTIFFNHEHNELPIGKTIAAEVDGNGLLITVEISQSKSADDVWTLIEEGILDRFSIGGRVLEAEEKRDEHGNLFNEITKIELFETSVVGLPANPEAKFQVVSKSFSQSITEEMRKKGEVQEMAKENKEIKEVQEVTKSEENSQEVEKQEEISKEVVEVIEETRESRKAALLKELEDLEAEESAELEANKETSTEETVEESNKSTEEAKEDTKEVKETSKETSQEDTEETVEAAAGLVVEEKSTDEVILETLSKIVELLSKKEDEDKDADEETTEEVAEETTEEVVEEVAEEVVEEVTKVAEVVEEEKVEKKVQTEEIVRKGEAQVIIADAPYGLEKETLSEKELVIIAKKAKDVAWTKLFYGKC